MKGLVYIFLLLPLLCFSQIGDNATAAYLYGNEADSIMIGGNKVYQKASVPSGNLYPFDDAAGPNDVASVTTGPPGWHDGVSSNNMSFTHVANGSGGYMVQGTVSGTNAARAEYQIYLDVGTYTRTLVASGNGTNKWRVITPQGLGGTYVTQTGVGNVDQPFLTGTLTTYTFTITVTVADTYQAWFDNASETDLDTVNIDSDTWIQN